MKIEKFCRLISITGVYLVLFLPLVVTSSMFFPFITGKNFAFRIIVEIIFAAWLILALKNIDYRPKRSWVLGAAAVFLAIIALADFTGVNPYRSFWSNFERMEGLVTHLHLFAYFVVVISMLKAEKLWTRFFNLSLGVSTVMGLYGLQQLAGELEIHQGGVRLDATLGNASYLAVYNLFHIFLAIWLAFRARNNSRWVYGGVAILNLIILYYTATRGAILGLLAGAFVSAVILAFTGRGKVRKYALISSTLVIIIVGSFLAVRNSAFVQQSLVLQRFAEISISETTSSSRYMVWRMAWQGFKERPLLGWGQENFSVVFNKYYDPGMYAQEPWFDRAHNVFFDWLIAGGILGLLGYLALYVLGMYSVLRSDLEITEKSLFVGLLVAYFVHNIFVFDNLISYLLFFSILGYIHYRFTNIKASQVVFAKNFSAGSINTAAVAVLVAFIFVFYQVNVKNISVNRGLIMSLRQYQDSPVANLAHFKRILNRPSFGHPEIREQLLSATSQVLMSSRASEQIKKEYFDLAITEYNEQIKESPLEARYPLFYGSFLLSIGEYDKGLAILKEAQALSPRKQLILFEIGRAYNLKKDYQQSLTVYKQAYELAPGYDLARDNYAAAAIAAGEQALADELMSATTGKILTSQAFIDAYTETGRYQELIAIWRQKIKEEPNVPQNHLSLAAAYVLSGDQASAIAEIERAVVLEPSFRSQANYLIGEIRAGRKPQ